MRRHRVGCRASRSPRSSPSPPCGGRPEQVPSSGCWRRERAGAAVRNSSWFSARVAEPTGARGCECGCPAAPTARQGGFRATPPSFATFTGGSTCRSRSEPCASFETGSSCAGSGPWSARRGRRRPSGSSPSTSSIAQPGLRGFLGPWVLQLTAFSDVLDNYGGGPGRVAIHGRGGTSLDDPLGTARSHGCVRIDNTNVTWLAHTVVPGTPVRIHA